MTFSSQVSKGMHCRGIHMYHYVQERRYFADEIKRITFKYQQYCHPDLNSIIT